MVDVLMRLWITMLRRFVLFRVHALEGFDGGAEFEDDITQAAELVVRGIGSCFCFAGLLAKVLDQPGEGKDLVLQPYDHRLLWLGCDIFLWQWVRYVRDDPVRTLLRCLVCIILKYVCECALR